MSNIPTIVKAEVFPVAGHDCMELNLSGHTRPILPEMSSSSPTPQLGPDLGRTFQQPL